MQTDYHSSKGEVKPSVIKNLICLSLMVFLILELPVIFNYKSPEALIFNRFSLNYFILLLVPHFILMCILVALIALKNIYGALNAFTVLWKRFKMPIRYIIMLFAILIVLLISVLYLSFIKVPSMLLLETCLLLLLLFGLIVILESSSKLALVYVSFYTFAILISGLEVLPRMGIYVPLPSLVPQHISSYMDLFEGWTPAKGGGPKPNLDVLSQGPTAYEPARFITNSAGFRNDRDFDEQPAPDAYRILYVGDSFVIGYATDQDKTSGYILETHLKDILQLNERSICPEVLIAYAGDPSGGWIRLRNYYLKYHPHLVVLGITFGNDISQAYFHSHPETGFYRLSEHDGNVSMTVVKDSLDSPYNDLFRGLYLPRDAFSPEALSPKPTPSTTLVSSNLQQMKYRYEQTQVGSKVMNAWMIFQQVLLVHQPEMVYQPSAIASTLNEKPGAVHTFDPNAALGLFYSPTLPEVDEAFTHFELILRGIGHLVQESGADLMVALFPQRFQVHPEDWEATVERYGLNPAHFDLEYPNRRILADCHRNGITCFDTLPLLKGEAQRTGKPFYFPGGDMHWRADGHYLVGVNMADFIWEQYLDKYNK